MAVLDGFDLIVAGALVACNLFDMVPDCALAFKERRWGKGLVWLLACFGCVWLSLKLIFWGFA